MMDVQDRSSQNWTDNRSDVMSAFLMRMSDFFCPSDRELALRGQIKTGWSTVAAKKKTRSSQMKLPPQEVKHIQSVVAQAEALQMAEEIRIGVQMLKLQRLRNSCRGNGTSTCILCGYDLVHHRSRSLNAIHVCFECAQAVCSRCKAEYKYQDGKAVVLCRLCSDERELWKKSGAWLNNKLPVVNISEDELEKAQKQITMQKVAMPMRTDFMVPASHMSDDEDDDLSTISGSTANYGGFSFIGSAPSSRSPSPDVSFMNEANAAAAAWKNDKYSSTELRPQSHKSLPKGKSPSAMRKSGSYDLVALRQNRSQSSTMPRKERTSSISRKPAMTGENKAKMEELRRRVIEKKKMSDLKRHSGGEPSLSLGVSPASDPLKMKRSRSNDFPMNTRLSPVPTSPHPHIKVVVPSPPTSPSTDRREPYRSGSPLIEATHAPRESTPKSHDQETTRGQITTTPTSSPPHNASTSSLSSLQFEKRKPVPSPRMKRPTTPEVDPTTVTTSSKEFALVAEGKKRFATIEREKPSAAPRRRTGSMENDKPQYRSLERKPRGGRTPEPQPSTEFKTITINSGRAPGSEPKPAAYSAVFPSDVNNEITSMLKKKVSSEEEEGTQNPHLKEIGKTLSITSEGSMDSQHSEGGAGAGAGMERRDSGGSADHTFRRKGARRKTGGRRFTNQMEIDEDESSSPRVRTRSGAMSGGGRGTRRSQQAPEEEESRSRTRSGAMAGGDIQAFRRARRVSPRRVTGSDNDGFPDPTELYGTEEADSMRRARGRRSGRTGGDLLVATDGQYGSVELSMEYSPTDQILSVTIHRCRGLLGVGSDGLSDPYVEIFLSPAPKKQVSFKTVIQRHTVNPQFEQNFVFNDVAPGLLDQTSLTLVVLDRHDASKDHPIGGISIPLYEVSPGQTANIRKLLGDPEKAVKEVLEKTEVGKIELCLSYDATASQLRVGVNQAVILMPLSKNYPNSYVTCHLQTPTMSVNVKRKTKTVGRATMPIFDQVLDFPVANAQLSMAILTLSMWDHRKVAKDVFLGELVMKGRKFWGRVKNTDLQNYDWYHLQEQQNSSSPFFGSL